MTATTHSRSPPAGRAGHLGQVGGDEDELAPGGGRVGGAGPLGQLAEREPAFDGGHPQPLHDRLTLSIGGADLAARVELSGLVVHAPDNTSARVVHDTPTELIRPPTAG
jgi:hypothetical protein